jgi:hypothetical protein
VSLWALGDLKIGLVSPLSEALGPFRREKHQRWVETGRVLGYKPRAWERFRPDTPFLGFAFEEALL